MVHNTKHSMSYKCALILPLFCADALVIKDTFIGTNAFRRSMTPPRTMTSRNMAGGGMGWGNNDFLSSLSGDNDDREEETQKYVEFKEAREAFEDRQRERMSSPAGQKFMQQQNLANERMGSQPVDSTGNFFEDMGFSEMPLEDSSSRFSVMMRQASARMEGNQPGIGNPTGFEQTFAVPLDEMESEEDL